MSGLAFHLDQGLAKYERRRDIAKKGNQWYFGVEAHVGADKNINIVYQSNMKRRR
jgi:hypothetical protein